MSCFVRSHAQHAVHTPRHARTRAHDAGQVDSIDHRAPSTSTVGRVWKAKYILYFCKESAPNDASGCLASSQAAVLQARSHYFFACCDIQIGTLNNIKNNQKTASKQPASRKLERQTRCMMIHQSDHNGCFRVSCCVQKIHGAV